MNSAIRLHLSCDKIKIYWYRSFSFELFSQIVHPL
jgi:hypothetical protein